MWAMCEFTFEHLKVVLKACAVLSFAGMMEGVTIYVLLFSNFHFGVIFLSIQFCDIIASCNLCLVKDIYHP